MQANYHSKNQQELKSVATKLCSVNVNTGDNSIAFLSLSFFEMQLVQIVLVIQVHDLEHPFIITKQRLTSQNFGCRRITQYFIISILYSIECGINQKRNNWLQNCDFLNIQSINHSYNSTIHIMMRMKRFTVEFGCYQVVGVRKTICYWPSSSFICYWRSYSQERCDLLKEFWHLGVLLAYFISSEFSCKPLTQILVLCLLTLVFVYGQQLSLKLQVSSKYCVVTILAAQYDCWGARLLYLSFWITYGPQVVFLVTLRCNQQL
eukprot:TRINITY_DN8527_c0_g1_i6.p1 TRINITY_DN8527_c0_g1~~TRINITY_DN8527_c0_g1_i6.p1  ORF type:complete len:263 (-),score=-16.36 TRINITY_DN8527_c0_g1_i6:35-823(-)